jgi:hypothetical protein
MIHDAGDWLSCVVQVEYAPNLPVAQAVELANLSQAVLCRFASVEYKDSRAPQNLYPIAGLERPAAPSSGRPEAAVPPAAQGRRQLRCAVPQDQRRAVMAHGHLLKSFQARLIDAETPGRTPATRRVPPTARTSGR